MRPVCPTWIARGRRVTDVADDVPVVPRTAVITDISRHIYPGGAGLGLAGAAARQRRVPSVARRAFGHHCSGERHLRRTRAVPARLRLPGPPRRGGPPPAGGGPAPERSTPLGPRAPR